MNLYEHTIIARQDISQSQLKAIEEKYIKLVEKFDGSIVKTENWGLMNLSYIIKKNRKGNYIHFKLKGSGKTILELEKNEKIDKNLLRYLTIKVKKFDLETNYFEKSEEKITKINNEKTYKKKSNQSNYSKLSIFSPQKYKFKKKCPLSVKGAPTIDYKNIKLLKRYVTENGKIISSRITSVTQKKQRELSLSIKRARNLALI